MWQLCGGGRIRLHLLPVGTNYGVAAVESGGKQGSTGALHSIFESVLNTKSPTPKGVGLFVVGEDGFEPSKRYAADLQSVPFGHSGTPPYAVICLGLSGAGRRT